MRSPKNRPGFTLIEMIAVITIIIILAGIVVGSMGFVQDKKSRETAKAQIALLSKAIEEYKMDMGEYPGTDNTGTEGDVSEELYQALFKDGYDYTDGDAPPTGTWDKARKIYLLQLDPRDNKQGWVKKVKTTDTVQDDLKIVDPWGNNYRYRRGTNARNPDFDLWSVGKDGKTNATDMKHKDNKDDIW